MIIGSPCLRASVRTKTVKQVRNREVLEGYERCSARTRRFLEWRRRPCAPTYARLASFFTRPCSLPKFWFLPATEALKSSNPSRPHSRCVCDSLYWARGWNPQTFPKFPAPRFRYFPPSTENITRTPQVKANAEAEQVESAVAGHQLHTHEHSDEDAFRGSVCRPRCPFLKCSR